jgi:hypothetical protein
MALLKKIKRKEKIESRKTSVRKNTPFSALRSQNALKTPRLSPLKCWESLRGGRRQKVYLKQNPMNEVDAVCVCVRARARARARMHACVRACVRVSPCSLHPSLATGILCLAHGIWGSACPHSLALPSCLAPHLVCEFEMACDPSPSVSSIV